MLKYPVGIQDFETLRKGNYAYVDKTEYIEKLQQTAKSFFLSRPRRFGKSLFVNTLKYFFLGRKDLFAGLYIEDKYDFEARPVIQLDFSNESWKETGLRKHIEGMLVSEAKKQGIVFETEGLGNRFAQLILSYNQKPVILIDEYDKPILHFIGKDDDRANENREIMREFYSILKPLDDKIHFLFITGITRFAKTSLFSDMNHLSDITISRHFSSICGYTQLELETTFSQSVVQMANENKIDLPTLWQNIKHWYNGYRWNVSTPTVYNPFSILQFLNEGSGAFQSYWFESGMPTFLIETINKNEDYDFEEVMVEPLLLNNFTITGLNSITLLFQAGYLTIKDSNADYVILEYPNFEVKRALLSVIIQDKTKDSQAPIALLKLRNYFENRQEKEIYKTFDALLAKIPYQIFKDKSEFYYHSVLVVAMQLLGCYIDAEVCINDGRVDAVLKTKEYIYIVEFKVDQSAGIALEQIKAKAYERAFQTDGRKLLLMGVNFLDKKVESLIIEELL